MKRVKNIFKQSADFVTSKLGFLRKETDKDIKELKQIETKLHEIEKKWIVVKEDTFTTKHMLKFRWAWLLIVFIGYLIFKSLNIIYLILTAYIVSLAVDAIIDFFQRKRLWRWIAIAITYMLLVIFLFSWFVLVIPFLLDQITDLIKIALGYVNNIQTILQTQSLTDIIQWMHRLPGYMKESLLSSIGDPNILYNIQSKLQENVSNIIATWSQYVQYLWGFAVNFVTWFFNFIIQMSIVITLSVFFSIEKIWVTKFFASLWWEKRYNYIFVKLTKIYKQLWIWLKTRIFMSLFIWLSMYLILWILSWCGLDLPNKWSLALILWLLDIVPYVGPFLWWLPAIIVGMMNFWMLWWSIMLVAIVFINFIENNVLRPIVMKKTVGTDPIVTIICMLIGWLILWIAGVLLAVPIAVIVTLLLEKKDTSDIL